MLGCSYPLLVDSRLRGNCNKTLFWSSHDNMVWIGNLGAVHPCMPLGGSLPLLEKYAFVLTGVGVGIHFLSLAGPVLKKIHSCNHRFPHLQRENNSEWNDIHSLKLQKAAISKLKSTRAMMNSICYSIATKIRISKRKSTQTLLAILLPWHMVRK